MQNLALYIHWPFCLSKCPYCDFNSHVAGVIDDGAWLNAYRDEIAYYAQKHPQRKITSVFFGGGTPSLMPPATVSGILDKIADVWTMADDVEITLEANPTSVEAEKFKNFASAGVNRLSLGIQALDDDVLKFLGREHSADAARGAIALAQKYFPRFSFDLIYAYHGQTMAGWKNTLTDALARARGHISLYQLTIEPGTQFHTRAQKGEVLCVADDAAANLYETTQEILGANNLPAYEISNHAMHGHESRHNLTYWHYDDYLGIGPGAHSRTLETGAHGRFLYDGARYATMDYRSPQTWLAKVMEHGHGVEVRDAVDTNIAQREALMMGLRLTSGLNGQIWRKKFNSDLFEFIGADKITALKDEGYLVRDGDILRLTPSGLQRLNAILTYLWG